MKEKPHFEKLNLNLRKNLNQGRRIIKNLLHNNVDSQQFQTKIQHPLPTTETSTGKNSFPTKNPSSYPRNIPTT